jgi:hypothetical protein
MNRLGWIILLFVVCAALVFGIVRLFELRYEAGDVYPPYSSLRSDPLGTMAFYEAIAGLSRFTVERDLSAGDKMPDGRGLTYFNIATTITTWTNLPDDAFRELELFVSGGGRLVITLFPQGAKSFLPDDDRERTPGKPKEKPLPRPNRDRWGIDFGIIALEQARNEYTPADVKNNTGLPLPDSLEWHSGIVITKLNSDWKVIYARPTAQQPAPVVVERQMGRGTAVIATDSYFLSNEAMQRDRHADLLSWLIGPNRRVMFDEAHLGVTDNPGMATLMRRYRLEWMVAALIILAILFIWKNSVSLIPARIDMASADYIAGKDTAAGFISLLRRGIPPQDLLALCFTRWKASADAAARISPQRIKEAEQIIEAEKAQPAKVRDTVKAYRKIAQILQAQFK